MQSWYILFLYFSSIISGPRLIAGIPNEISIRESFTIFILFYSEKYVHNVLHTFIFIYFYLNIVLLFNVYPICRNFYTVTYTINFVIKKFFFYY